MVEFPDCAQDGRSGLSDFLDASWARRDRLWNGGLGLWDFLVPSATRRDLVQDWGFGCRIGAAIWDCVGLAWATN